MAFAAKSNSDREQTGSPPLGEPVFLVLGLLRRAHGLHGDVIMDVYTDFPERLTPQKTVLVGENHRPLVIEAVRSKGKELLIRFEGYDNPESTADLRNQRVYISAQEIPGLPEGKYYYHQLINLRVVKEDGTEIGTVEDILETGANDVYVVKTSAGEEIMIPAVDEFVLAVDLEKRIMTVSLPIWE